MHNVKKSVDALGNINSYIVKKYMVVGNIGPRIGASFHLMPAASGPKPTLRVSTT